MRNDVDTVIFAATPESFTSQFIGERCWSPVRLSANALLSTRYIAIYRVAPIAAITHWAPIKAIEVTAIAGKYKIIFSDAPQEIEPVLYDGDNRSRIQGARFTTLSRLKAAKRISDLLPW